LSGVMQEIKRVPAAIFGAQSAGSGEVGLRRVDWVRLVVASDRTYAGAEVIGVGSRIPMTRSIPISVAKDLIASGTPYVIRHLGAGA
jgi:hypothetical protein